MATAPAAPVAPIAATASVSTTPVLRLVAVGEPVVQPLTVQWWGQVPWIDTHSGWPLWWPESERPAKAKDWMRPAIHQKKAGKLVVELSLAPGATLDAQPRQGWDVPVIAKASSTPRTLTEVLRVQGQVATTAHVPASTPRILEHDVLDAERGTRLVPSISSAGVLWVPRPAVGYVVVEYEASMVTLEAEFGITTAPWTPETRQRVLQDLVFAGKAEDTPPLMIRVQVRDPRPAKRRVKWCRPTWRCWGCKTTLAGLRVTREMPLRTIQPESWFTPRRGARCRRCGWSLSKHRVRGWMWRWPARS